MTQALEQPEHEPVAWLTDRETIHFDKDDAWRDCDGFIQPLYTEPPKREWVGLTVADIKQGLQESWVTEQAWQSAVWWAEAKLREKNS